MAANSYGWTTPSGGGGLSQDKYNRSMSDYQQSGQSGQGGSASTRELKFNQDGSMQTNQNSTMGGAGANQMYYNQSGFKAMSPTTRGQQAPTYAMNSFGGGRGPGGMTRSTPVYAESRPRPTWGGPQQTGPSSPQYSGRANQRPQQLYGGRPSRGSETGGGGSSYFGNSTQDWGSPFQSSVQRPKIPSDSGISLAQMQGFNDEQRGNTKSWLENVRNPDRNYELARYEALANNENWGRSFDETVQNNRFNQGMERDQFGFQREQWGDTQDLNWGQLDLNAELGRDTSAQGWAGINEGARQFDRNFGLQDYLGREGMAQGWAGVDQGWAGINEGARQFDRTQEQDESQFSRDFGLRAELGRGELGLAGRGMSLQELANAQKYGLDTRGMDLNELMGKGQLEQGWAGINNQNAQFYAGMGEEGRQFDVGQQNTLDMFGRRLGEEGRQFDTGLGWEKERFGSEQDWSREQFGKTFGLAEQGQMWGQGFQEQELAQQAALQRELMQNQLTQSRYSAFGRAQAPTASFSRNWG